MASANQQAAADELMTSGTAYADWLPYSASRTLFNPVVMARVRIENGLQPSASCYRWPLRLAAAKTAPLAQGKVIRGRRCCARRMRISSLISFNLRVDHRAGLHPTPGNGQVFLFWNTLSNS